MKYSCFPNNNAAQCRRGPLGIPFQTGPQGPQGYPGPSYLPGDPGPEGNVGPNGNDGIQGPQGIAGLNGAIIYRGTGEPTATEATMPGLALTVGSPIYIQENGNVWYYKGGGWILLNNIIGSAGIKGPDGPPGNVIYRYPTGNIANVYVIPVPIVGPDLGSGVVTSIPFGTQITGSVYIDFTMEIFITGISAPPATMYVRIQSPDATPITYMESRDITDTNRFYLSDGIYRTIDYDRLLFYWSNGLNSSIQNGMAMVKIYLMEES
jgi:hypothetical protein